MMKLVNLLNVKHKSKKDVNRVYSAPNHHIDKLPPVALRSCDSLGCPLVGYHGTSCLFHARKGQGRF